MTTFFLKYGSFLALLVTLSQPALAVTDQQFEQMQTQLNQLAEQLENNASSTQSSATHVGGYGELHYNNLSSDANGDTKKLDLHRFVLFVGHEFNKSIRFFSEFEIEHAVAGDGKKGEVEVEQAYIQFDINPQMQVNAGVFLIPVGIINETHEPTVFYGVERNPVEKNIIPATWWEGGAMLSGHHRSGLAYDIALHSGLNGGENIRSGRQKTAKAHADNLAITARVKYTAIAGLELAATLQVQDDITQDSSDKIDGATLIETHARLNKNNFTATALYARWDIDGETASNNKTDEQTGGYLELAYKPLAKVGLFARHNLWDNGGMGETGKTQTDIGLNYWPHEDVVVKFDYQIQNEVAGDNDGFNLGIGYQF